MSKNSYVNSNIRKFTNKYFGGVFSLVYVGKDIVELLPEGSQKIITLSYLRFIQEFQEV